jgi:hypothetical protein
LELRDCPDLGLVDMQSHPGVRLDQVPSSDIH